MSVTTPDERRRLEAAGARLLGRSFDGDDVKDEFWSDDAYRTGLSIYSDLRIIEAHGNPDTILRWLLAWRRPDLLDAEAEIARLRAEAERLRTALEKIAAAPLPYYGSPIEDAYDTVYRDGAGWASEIAREALRGGDAP